MKYRILHLLLFLTVTGNNLATNVLSLDSLTANPFYTLTIEVTINNEDPFVAFQFDVQLPDGFDYVDGSAEFSGRESNHVLMPSDLGNNLRRFVAFSPSNEFFTGNSGHVMKFKIVLPSSTGIYPLEIENVIIGNMNSENILTQVVEGIVNVGGVSALETLPNIKNEPYIFPNPVTEQSILRFPQAIQGVVTIQPIGLTGEIAGFCFQESLPAGSYDISLGNIIPAKVPANKTVSFIQLTTPTFSKTIKIIQ